MSKKYAEGGDVATVAVCLDKEKPPMLEYAKQLTGWSVLCDYKGWDSRSVKDYGIKGVPGTVILDARGRIRVPDSLDFWSEHIIEDLRLEAFWAKKRGAAAPAAAEEAPQPAEGTAAPAASAVKWVFHLKSGGKLKVVSYEEKDGKFILKLAVGSTTVSKEDVEKVTPADSK